MLTRAVACFERALLDARLRDSRLWLVRNKKISYMIDAATSMKENVHACQQSARRALPAQCREAEKEGAPRYRAQEDDALGGEHGGGSPLGQEGRGQEARRKEALTRTVYRGDRAPRVRSFSFQRHRE
jgi:hypothetical protein